MSENLAQKIIALIADQLHVDAHDVSPESTLEGLGADSLDRVELVIKFEDEFGIEIRDEDAEKLVTVADLIAYVTRLSAT